MRLNRNDRATAYGIYCMSDILEGIKHPSIPTKADDGCDGMFDFAESTYNDFTSSPQYYDESKSEYDAMRDYINETFKL